MALVRPNQTIILDLDERLATQDTKLEVKRCYTHIGTPLFRSHAPGEGDQDAPCVNTARVLVSVGAQDYLHSAEDGADGLWEAAVKPGIANTLQRVGANMKAFNRRQRKIGLPAVDIDRLDFELQDGQLVIGLHPDPESFLSRELVEQVDLARRLFNDGALADAMRIDMPSKDSYLRQYDEQKAIWDERQRQQAELDALEAMSKADEPLTEAQIEEERLRKIAEQAVADKKLGTERFFDEEWLDADAERKSYERTAVAPVDSDALPPAYHVLEDPQPELFSFEVDYRLWGVTCADGTEKVFDSAAGRFAA